MVQDRKHPKLDKGTRLPAAHTNGNGFKLDESVLKESPPTPIERLNAPYIYVRLDPDDLMDPDNASEAFNALRLITPFNLYESEDEKKTRLTEEQVENDFLAFTARSSKHCRAPVTVAIDMIIWPVVRASNPQNLTLKMLEVDAGRYRRDPDDDDDK